MSTEQTKEEQKGGSRAAGTKGQLLECKDAKWSCCTCTAAIFGAHAKLNTTTSRWYFLGCNTVMSLSFIAGWQQGSCPKFTKE
jgi:hypothetical protein